MFQFRSVLNKCLEAASLGGFEFSAHSFRIGTATEASRRGLGNALIKKIGRWESYRFRI